MIEEESARDQRGPDEREERGPKEREFEMDETRAIPFPALVHLPTPLPPSPPRSSLLDSKKRE